MVWKEISVVCLHSIRELEMLSVEEIRKINSYLYLICTILNLKICVCQSVMKYIESIIKNEHIFIYTSHKIYNMHFYNTHA